MWTVQSQQQLADAHRLLGSFLPRLFRRPVADEVRQQYVAIVEERLAAGDCFELSDFVVINQKLATHYDIPNVVGTAMRRVPVPANCPRGGFMTQASMPPVESPALRTAPVAPAELPTTNYEFDGAHEVRLRLLGLFIPEQVASFRKSWNGSTTASANCHKGYSLLSLLATYRMQVWSESKSPSLGSTVRPVLSLSTTS